MSMRILHCAITAMLLASTPALADGPVFTRAGGVAAPGTSPAWSISAAGSAAFAKVQAGSISGDASGATAGDILLSTLASEATAAQPASTTLAPLPQQDLYRPGSTAPITSGIGYTPVADKSVFVSATSGFPAFTAANTAFTRAEGRVGLSAAALTLGDYISNPAQLQAVSAAFAGTSGSIGLFHDLITTPHLPQYRMPLGTGDGATTAFTASAGLALSAGHVQVTSGASIVATDNGSGALSGPGGTGTVNYTTGAVRFTFSTAPAAGTALQAGFWLTTTFSGSLSVPATWTTVWDFDRTDAWPTWLAQIGWAPTMGLLNVNGSGQAAYAYAPIALTDTATATADIKAADPAIEAVIPFVSPNSGVYGTFATDAYWATARQIALQQGGLAIDAPAGLFLTNPGGGAYRALVEQEIQWAAQNGLVSIIELTPYSTNPADCTTSGICQFSPDPHFMSSVQDVVRQLEDAGALPTVWFVDQYSEVPASPQPGTDDTTSASYTPNSINAIARWVSENAPTAPYPVAMRGVQSPGYTVAPPEVQAGNPTLTPTAGANRGLGSMATQDSSNVRVYLSLTIGSGPCNLVVTPDNAGNAAMGTCNSNGTITLPNNVTSTGNLTGKMVTAGLSNPLQIAVDGAGNGSIGTSIPNGTISVPNNLTVAKNLTGASVSAGLMNPLIATADGAGNASLGTGIPNGTISVPNNVTVAKNLTGASLSAGLVNPLVATADGAGNASLGTGIANGTLTLPNNVTIGKNVTAQTYAETGFVTPASSTSACIPGAFGDAFVSGIPYHYYCYAANQWSRVVMSTTGF